MKKKLLLRLLLYMVEEPSNFCIKWEYRGKLVFSSQATSYMTALPPPEPPEIQPSPITPPEEAKAKTAWGRLAETAIANVWEVIDQLGRSLMGELWRTVYLTVQDAIAISFLVRIPGLLSLWISGKDFSSFDLCLKENPLGSTFWACYLIVIADFASWVVLAARFSVRFIKDLREQFKE